MSGTVLIVGGESEVATGTAAYLRALGYPVVATTRRRDRAGADRPFLDLREPLAEWPVPAGVRAACICAAIARLADCERDPEGAARVNISGTIGLADRLLAQGIAVLFLSTDKVFDGTSPLMTADAPLCPATAYGRQKAQTEAALGERLRAGAPVTILRLAKVVSPGMPLLKQWAGDLAAGRPISAFHDLKMAPVPVALVAAAIERLVAEPHPGIFQLSGPRDIAYDEVALRLARRIGGDPALVQRVASPGPTAEHTTLDSSVLRDRFGLVVPDAWDVVDALIESCR